MPFFVQTDKDLTAIVAGAAEGAGGARHLMSYEQLEVHATKSGMLMVFVCDLKDPEHAPERRKAGHFEEAAAAAISLELKALADGYRRLIRGEPSFWPEPCRQDGAEPGSGAGAVLGRAGYGGSGRRLRVAAVVEIEPVGDTAACRRTRRDHPH